SFLKPVEAAVRVIATLLLGQEQSEAKPLGECGPSRTEIVAGGTLRASVQNNNECALRRKPGWQVREHPQCAWVGTKIQPFPEDGSSENQGPKVPISP